MTANEKVPQGQKHRYLTPMISGAGSLGIIPLAAIAATTLVQMAAVGVASGVAAGVAAVGVTKMVGHMDMSRYACLPPIEQ